MCPVRGTCTFTWTLMPLLRLVNQQFRLGGTWAHVSATTYTFTNVAAGLHIISVQLVNNDHTPVVPLVVAKISVNATPVPTLTIVTPTNGVVTPSSNIAVAVQVTNFNVVDKQGQTNVPGEGHLHFYLDVTPPTTPGQPAIPTSGVWAHVSATTYTFNSVVPGPHTIWVQLVNNDHTPVTPPVVAQIRVTVAPNSGGGGGGGY